MFKKAAIATAGVATVGILGRSATAHAADGGNVVIGNETQTAQSPTALIACRFHGQPTCCSSTTAPGYDLDDTIVPAAIAGWSGSRSGIYGFTANGLAGVVACRWWRQLGRAGRRRRQPRQRLVAGDRLTTDVAAGRSRPGRARRGQQWRPVAVRRRRQPGRLAQARRSGDGRPVAPARRTGADLRQPPDRGATDGPAQVATRPRHAAHDRRHAQCEWCPRHGDRSARQRHDHERGRAGLPDAVAGRARGRERRTSTGRRRVSPWRRPRSPGAAPTPPSWCNRTSPSTCCST